MAQLHAFAAPGPGAVPSLHCRGLLPLFLPYLSGGPAERAAVAGLDAGGRLAGFAETAGDASSIGTVLPAIRSILGRNTVIEIIVAHSHPHHSCCPSKQDEITTARLSALCRLASAELTDHLIFGADGIYSMTENTRYDAGTLRLCAVG